MTSISETGDVVDTLIDGRGVIHTESKRVFVDSTITGEKIQFERFKKKKTMMKQSWFQFLMPRLSELNRNVNILGHVVVVRFNTLPLMRKY